MLWLLPPLSIGRRYRYCCAAMAKANVVTASSRPLTRSAPSPMRAAVAAAIPAASNMETRYGTRGKVTEKNSHLSPMPTPTVSPRLNPAANRAPMPAKAIWPRESWPAQPVTMVMERAHMAKARMLAYSRWRDGLVTR